MSTRTVLQLADAVRTGELRAVDVLDDALACIETGNGPLNAFVHLDAELARTVAERVDEAVDQGRDPGPLAGVPFGVKDLEDCAGMPTSVGSLLHKGGPPVEEDSVHVARLRAAGAVPVGKTAASEYGLDSATHTVAWGVTRNPWDTSRTPGGSSGGSAAAVAAGLVPFATSSDGGGSTRSPAAFTGLVGLKPTHGLIGMRTASDLMVRGALTRTVADTARLLDVMAGPTPTDRTSQRGHDPGFEHVIERLVTHGITAAWSPDLGYAAVEPDVVQVAREAADDLIAAAGLTLLDVPLALTNPFTTWLRMVAFLARGSFLLDGVWPDRADELSPILREVIGMGSEVGATDFVAAQRDRGAIERQVAELFDTVDVLLTPATACVAFDAEGPIPNVIAGQDASGSGPEAFGMFVNMTWIPAISVPAGLSPNGLPVGLQIAAPRGRDDLVLRLARILETARPWPSIAPVPVGR